MGLSKKENRDVELNLYLYACIKEHIGHKISIVSINKGVVIRCNDCVQNVVEAYMPIERIKMYGKNEMSSQTFEFDV